MNDTVVVLSAMSAIVAGTPILLAALGEIVTERYVTERSALGDEVRA